MIDKLVNYIAGFINRVSRKREQDNYNALKEELKTMRKEVEKL